MQDDKGLKLGSHFKVPQTSWLTVPSKMQTMFFRLVFEKLGRTRSRRLGLDHLCYDCVNRISTFGEIQCATNHRDLAEKKPRPLRWDRNAYWVVIVEESEQALGLY